MKPVTLIATVSHPLDGSQESLIEETVSVTEREPQRYYKVQNTDTLAGILIKFNIKLQDLKRWNTIHSEQDIHCGSGVLRVSPPPVNTQDDVDHKHRNSIDSTVSRKSHDSGCFIESKLEQELDLIKNLVNAQNNHDRKGNHYSTKDSLELVNFETKENWRWS